MRTVWLCLSLAATLSTNIGARASGQGEPGCADKSPKQCVDLALDAMGGQDRLQEIKIVRLRTIEHTALAEQSYRQAPFITSYETAQTTLDLVNGRVFSDVKLTWPESDPGQSEIETTLVVGPEGGVRRDKDGDSPCRPADLASARYTLASDQTMFCSPLTAPQTCISRNQKSCALPCTQPSVSPGKKSQFAFYSTLSLICPMRSRPYSNSLTSGSSGAM